MGDSFPPGFVDGLSGSLLGFTSVSGVVGFLSGSFVGSSMGRLRIMISTTIPMSPAANPPHNMGFIQGDVFCLRRRMDDVDLWGLPVFVAAGVTLAAEDDVTGGGMGAVRSEAVFGVATTGGGSGWEVGGGGKGPKFNIVLSAVIAASKSIEEFDRTGFSFVGCCPSGRMSASLSATSLAV